MATFCICCAIFLFIIATIYLFANKNIRGNKVGMTLRNSISFVLQTIYLLIGLVR